jgi:hypothetical protein
MFILLFPTEFRCSDNLLVAYFSKIYYHTPFHGTEFFFVVGVISPLKYSHPACNYYQVQEIYVLSVLLACTGITFNHVWWKSVTRFKSWMWNMYEHKQRHFNFIREIVHLSEESRPKGGDINCLGRFVREWEWKLWRKTKKDGMLRWGVRYFCFLFGGPHFTSCPVRSYLGFYEIIVRNTVLLSQYTRHWQKTERRR